MAARLLGAQRAQQKQLNHGKRIHDGDPSNRAWRHHYIRLNEEKSTIAQSSEIGGRCMLCKKRDWSLCPKLKNNFQEKDVYESWLNLLRRFYLCCKHDSRKNVLLEWSWSQINSSIGVGVSLETLDDFSIVEKSSSSDFWPLENYWCMLLGLKNEWKFNRFSRHFDWLSLGAP